MKIKKPNAFTLIELLVAVTIFSIIALSIYSAFYAGVRVWRRANTIIEFNQSMRVFFDIISVDLKNAVHYSDAEDAENFKGDGHEMSFRTLVDVYGASSRLQSELMKVIYRYDGAAGAVKRIAAGKLEGFDEEHGKIQDMIKGIEAEYFTFEYCYKEPASESEYEYRWKNVWDDPKKIPRGVKVAIGKFKKIILLPAGELIEEK